MKKRMRRFSESRLGLGHITEVLRAAEKAGVQAIVNDADGVVLLYDPTKKEWVILDNAYLSRIDATVFDVIEDRSTFGQVWWDCRATEFKDFKVEWNKLFSAAAQGDEDVFASSNCEQIRMDFKEKTVNESIGGTMTAAELVDALGEFPENMRVAASTNGEYEEGVVSCWHNDAKKVFNLDLYDKYYGTPFQDEWTVKDVLTAINRWLKGDLSEWKVTIGNCPIEEVKMSDTGETLLLDHTWNGQVNEAQVSESRMSGGMRQKLADWYVNAFPSDAEEGNKMAEVGSTFQDLWRALERGEDVYDVMGDGDSIVRERLFERLAELKRTDYDTIYEMWLGIEDESMARVSEGLDDPRDWSASEGEVEIMWETDSFEDFGIFRGEGSTYVIDYDRVDTHDQLVNEVCRLIGKEYPDLDFEPDDFIITNEDEFWEQRGGNPGKLDDDDLYLESSGTIDAEIEIKEDSVNAGVKAGERMTVTLDLAEADECYDLDELIDYVTELANDILKEEGREKGSWLHYSNVRILNEDELVKAIKGDRGWGQEIDFSNFTADDLPESMTFKEGMEFYKKMYDGYYNKELNYNVYRDLKDKLVDVVVAGLMKESSIEDLGKEWFKDYGTMNGWGWKTSFKYNIACKLHKIHMKKHPDEHRSVPQRHNWRGWHENNCSCGLCSSSDSSD